MGKEHLKTQSTFEATADEQNGFMLALCAWREARGEGHTPSERLNAMRAVMHVIRNRVAAGMGDWIGVITTRNQFSSISFKGDSQLVIWPDDDDGLWMATLGMANTIYHGRDVDPTGGALYYANLKTMDKGGWFERNIVGSIAHPELKRIGNHTFFA